ncbi:MAG TPA: hypothetical protein VGI11_08215 [Variovorax sp.]
MEFMQWLGVAAGLAVLAAGGLVVMPRIMRGKGAGVARSVDKAAFPTTSGGGTAFGRLSTIR